jgi:hypothetical protein
VSRDCIDIQQKAIQEMTTYFEHALPLAFARTVNEIIKTCWEIAEDQNQEPKDRLTALALGKEPYDMLMDLMTNKHVITDTYNVVHEIRYKAERLQRTNEELGRAKQKPIEEFNPNYVGAVTN